MKPKAPWSVEVRQRSLVLRLPEKYRTLSWASLGGGWKRANTIINHQIGTNDRAATDAPRQYLAALARSLGHDPRSTVAMMTGVPMRHAAGVSLFRQGLAVAAWCTAGRSNALRVGDPASVESVRPGTINIILLINQALNPPAMVEALQIATEGRVAALGMAAIKSVISHKLATGTGTDCIVVAAPDDLPAHIYCGKHTRLGELIGRAVIRSCTRALASWNHTNKTANSAMRGR
jgi:adenosylcobinamide amidohydrolase